MKSQPLITIAAALLVAGSPLQAGVSSTQIQVKTTVSATAAEKAETDAVAEPRPAAQSRASGQLVAPGGRAGKCCEKPAPFPGLYCCDTRDCGWFDCDAEVSGEPKKQFR